MKASDILRQLNECDVKDCHEKAKRIFSPDGKIPFMVCEFHYLELSTEKAFTTDSQGRLIVGDDVPPLLTGMRIRVSAGDPIITMTLTKPGEPEQTVKFRVPAKNQEKWLRFLDFPFGDDQPAVIG